eukprot:g24524.t1
MAKWFKEHLGFRSSKGPPQPPKPDYRPRPGAEPDILAAYKLQKERDFEDPYTGGSRCLQRLRSEGEAAGPGAGSTAAPGAPGTGSSPHSHPAKKAASPELKYVSPKHRLIKVENPEKSCSKLATSPEDNKQDKVLACASLIWKERFEAMSLIGKVVAPLPHSDGAIRLLNGQVHLRGRVVYSCYSEL